MGILDIQNIFKQELKVNEIKVNSDEKGKPHKVKTSRYMKIVRFWLAVSGLWKNSNNRSRNKPVNVAIFSIMLMGFSGTAYELFFNTKSINSGMEVLMTVFLIGHSISTYIVLIWKQPSILMMLATVESRFDHFSQTHLGHSRFQTDAERSNAVWVIMISVIIFSVHTSSVVVSKGYLFLLPLEKRSLLLPITMPFELSERTFYVIYVLELVCMVCEAITHITSITLCTGFINILCAEFTALGKTFRHLADIVARDVSRCNRKEMLPIRGPEVHHDLHANILLQTLVDHHIRLLQFHKDLQTSFGIAIFDMFVTSQVMLCTSGFHIYKLFLEGEGEQLFKELCMFTALISHEFVYFWFGSQLTNKAVLFRMDVGGCAWFQRCRKFTRGYRILLERTKRRVTIQAVILPTNLATFIRCLQAAASYFNILLALSYKQEKSA